MSAPSVVVFRFIRYHFATRLPTSYTYTLAHFWLREDSADAWRIGMTSFATRMLGEIVEFDFEVESDQKVAVAQVIGWIEGFKAVSDIFCVSDGHFLGVNPIAAEDTEAICRDPYGDGWLYSVRGRPDPGVLSVDGYVEHLNRTIDKMLEQPWKSGNLQSGDSNSP